VTITNLEKFRGDWGGKKGGANLSEARTGIGVAGPEGKAIKLRKNIFTTSGKGEISGHHP